MSQNAIQGVFMVRANAIPTPAAGALLGLAGLAALRRRRA
jgi:MYXO-CTERM domain-containing protein